MNWLLKYLSSSNKNLLRSQEISVILSFLDILNLFLAFNEKHSSINYALSEFC